MHDDEVTVWLQGLAQGDDLAERVLRLLGSRLAQVGFQLIGPRFWGLRRLPASLCLSSRFNQPARVDFHGQPQADGAVAKRRHVAGPKGRPTVTRLVAIPVEGQSSSGALTRARRLLAGRSGWRSPDAHPVGRLAIGLASRGIGLV